MGMITIYFPAVCNDSFQMFGQEQWCQISVPFFASFCVQLYFVCWLFSSMRQFLMIHFKCFWQEQGCLICQCTFGVLLYLVSSLDKMSLFL